jgi:hypothetical protein
MTHDSSHMQVEQAVYILEDLSCCSSENATSDVNGELLFIILKS